MLAVTAQAIAYMALRAAALNQHLHAVLSYLSCKLPNSNFYVSPVVDVPAWHGSHMSGKRACAVKISVVSLKIKKKKKYGLPDANMELVGDFYTILIGFTMEAAEQEPYDPQGITSLHCRPGVQFVVR